MPRNAPTWTPLGRGTIVGYCTNVHAGTTLEQMLENLQRFAVPVRQAVCPGHIMGVGLWLSAQAARSVFEQGQSAPLRDLLAEQGLAAYTFNGFPHGDFHEPVVKHRVYSPPWGDPERTRYTLDLAAILSELLPPGAEGSISTVPIGWPGGVDAPAAAAGLRAIARELAALEGRTGRLIHLDIEPEPGCIIQDSASAVDWFQDHLLRGDAEAAVRRHLRLCHDVCHAAVMFDDQAEAVAAYQRAGILVGKVQVSSAIQCELGGNGSARSGASFDAALSSLGQFREDRYLHQTVVRADSTRALFDDLPPALAALGVLGQGRPPADVEVRTHFHVPIYLDRIDQLVGTTQPQIAEAVRLLRGRVAHWEIETYAWPVLPPALRRDDMAAGIADELRWFARLIQSQEPS